MARRNTTAVPVPVTEAGETPALIEVPEAPAYVAIADRLLTASADSVLADVTLHIHDGMRAFDKAATAYDKARVSMVRAAVPVVRATAELYLYAENTKDKTFIAERGVNAGKPAVAKLASHLGYERRRFDKFYNAALALIEADAPAYGDVTPEDLELIAPFFTKDAERKRAERNADKADKPAGAPDQPEENDAETAGPSGGNAPADDSVILADVIKAIEHAATLAERFAANAGLTRDTMDAIQDALSGISTTLEAVVAEDD